MRPDVFFVSSSPTDTLKQDTLECINAFLSTQQSFLSDYPVPETCTYCIRYQHELMASSQLKVKVTE